MVMEKQHAAVKNRLEKIRERRMREVDEAEINGDMKAYFNAVESLNRDIVNAMLEFEDQNWKPLADANGWNQSGEKGIAYQQLKLIVEKAEEMTKVNALMGHALRIKTNHVLGRGFTFDFTTTENRESISKRNQAIIDDPENQRVLFSPSAIKSIARTLWNKGNVFVMWDQVEKEFSLLSVDKAIQPEYLSYDDNPSRIKYFKRTYTKRNDISEKGESSTETQTVEEWVPVLEYREKLGKDLPKVLNVAGKPEKVNQRAVIIDLRVNKDEEDTWGLPDSFAAIPWAWASSEYIKDGSKLLKAYAAIAYQIKTKGETAKKGAGAAIASGKIAGSAVTGPDTEISQVNRASAVDLYTGRPIQAMFASAVDLSVTSVTNDTGKGGAYGSEQVLTTPELMSALSRQEDFAGFFKRIFRAMKLEGTIKFRSLSVDPIHRQIQSLGLAFLNGFISQEEGRAATLPLLDIDGDPKELPVPNEFTGSKAATLAANLDSPIPAQGKSGAVGALADGDNSNRDEE